jgi:hypothetical protein
MRRNISAYFLPSNAYRLVTFWMCIFIFPPVLATVSNSSYSRQLDYSVKEYDKTNKTNSMVSESGLRQWSLFFVLLFLFINHYLLCTTCIASA